MLQPLVEDRIGLAVDLVQVAIRPPAGVPRPLQPGKARTLAFTSQMLTARRLAAGSRIVAVVGVPKQPRSQINYGTGGDVSAESIADAKEPLRIRWAVGSYLEIGVREPPDGP